MLLCSIPPSTPPLCLVRVVFDRLHHYSPSTYQHDNPLFDCRSGTIVSTANQAPSLNTLSHSFLPIKSLGPLRPSWSNDCKQWVAVQSWGHIRMENESFLQVNESSWITLQRQEGRTQHCLTRLACCKCTHFYHKSFHYCLSVQVSVVFFNSLKVGSAGSILWVWDNAASCSRVQVQRAFLQEKVDIPSTM
jgi:hypothetical protein